MVQALLVLIWILAFGTTWWAFHRSRLRSPWHLDVAMLGLLALATLGFFWRVAVGQNWMPADGGDLVSFLYPTYRFAAATLQQGTWPLWNPYLYMGAPHVADIQAGFLYPPNLLLFLLQPAFPYRALQWLSIGHVWFAGAGMYLFLARGQGFARPAALVGALAFMFSDAFIVHFGNLNLNAVASWLPWVFWAYLAGLGRTDPHPHPISRNETGTTEATAERPAYRWAAIAGVLLAVGSLAGHIQATSFIVLALVAYSLLWLWLRRDCPAPLRRGLSLLAYGGLFVAVTVLLAAPILLPAFQLTAYTTRATWNYGEAAGYSLAPAQWIGWLIPGFFGRSPQYHWGLWPRVEVGYLGVLPLILAGLTFVLRRDRWAWLWGGLAAISFLLASGIYGIVHGWLTLLPGFGQFRAPARLVLVTDFALAVLAARGIDAVLGPLGAAAGAYIARVKRWLAYATGAVWGVGVPLAYLALLLTQDREPAIVSRVSVALIAILTFGGLLLASLVWLMAVHGRWGSPRTLGWLAAGLVLLDLASNGAYQDLGNQDPSQTFQHPAIAAFLAQSGEPFRIDTRTDIDALWQPDAALLYGLEDVGGIANPLQLASTARYWEGLGSRSTPLYDLLNVRYVIARKNVDLDWSKFVLAFEGDPDLNVYENRDYLPRALLVPSVQAVSNQEMAWNAIHEAGFDPRATAVVENAGSPTAAIAEGGRGTISDLRSRPGYLSLSAAVDAPVLLLISQTWYPGWQVWIDGLPVGQPLRADYTFQGVALPAGSHQVELRFAPSWWPVGWAAAGLASAALIIWGILATIRK